MLQFIRVYVVRRLIAYVRYINSLLISRGQSSEFHYFPFDTTKPMPVGAVALMPVLCSALEKLGLSYRITDGTALGLYRDKSFIQHDNDIDVDVLDCFNVDLIHKSMRDKGMKLGRRVSWRGKIQQLTYYNDKNIIFDMVFWYTRNKQIVNYSELGYLRVQPSKHFVSLSKLYWKGKKYPVASNTQDWLVLRYGKDWRIPKRIKDDWKLECNDLIKLKSSFCSKLKRYSKAD